MKDRPRRVRSVRLVAAVVGLAACGGAASDRPAAAPPSETATADTLPAAAEYRVVPVTDGGTISGVVRFEGPPPPPDTFAVADGSEACGVRQIVQPVRLGAGGGLADAVVSLAGLTAGAPPETPVAPTLLDQVGCRFVPRVMVVPVGATVEVRNSDPVTHNVHTAAFANRSVNRSQPPSAPAVALTFSAPDLVRVRCDLHPWMGAWIVVVDRPYTALTDSDGHFTLPNVPPGAYRLETWHESLGRTTQEVTVAAEATTEVTIRVSGAAAQP